jgi:RNA polymerase sigma factor (sigma-70 family)
MATRELGRFDRLILPHLDDAYALACYLLRDEHDAQDVVQDAVLRALRHFDGYRDGDPRAWLLSIVRNCCHTRLSVRRNGEVPLPEAETVHAPQLRDANAADDRAIRSSERAAIQRALAELPLEFREVIVLREINGLSYKEISDVTGVPAGTVMSRLARARRRLAASLGTLVSQAS